MPISLDTCLCIIQSDIASDDKIIIKQSRLLSHVYSDCNSNDQKFMMVASVLVGYTTKGSSSMTRPPLNSATGMLYDTTVDDEKNPRRFVKYDKQEYYPEYVIEYTTK